MLLLPVIPRVNSVYGARTFRDRRRGRRRLGELKRVAVGIRSHINVNYRSDA